ncbi:hypothetical protein Tco_0086625 [Tanacetum coccineum]
MVPLKPHYKTDEQMVPSLSWVTIGKSNLHSMHKKSHLLDICGHPEEYQLLTKLDCILQMILPLSTCNSSGRQCISDHSCQTPPAHPFELPPTGDTVLDFVNELGYPEPDRICLQYTDELCVKNKINIGGKFYLAQPSAVTGKVRLALKQNLRTRQFCKCCGIVTSKLNNDLAELYGRVYSRNQTFFSQQSKANKTSLKNPTKKTTPPSSN